MENLRHFSLALPFALWISVANAAVKSTSFSASVPLEQTVLGPPAPSSVVQEFNREISCILLIQNASETSAASIRLRSLKVFQPGTGLIDAETTPNASNHFSMKLLVPGGNPNPPSLPTACMKDPIPPGGQCLVHFRVSSSSNLALCSGNIQIEEIGAENRSPTAVLVAGSVQTIHEMRALGGVLSGSYYASGTPWVRNNRAYLASPELSAAPSVPADATASGLNMNAFCEASCIKANPAASAACSQHCGIAGGRQGAGNQPRLFRLLSQFTIRNDTRGFEAILTPSPSGGISDISNHPENSLPRVASGNVTNLRMICDFGSIRTGMGCDHSSVGSRGFGAPNDWASPQIANTCLNPYRERFNADSSSRVPGAQALIPALAAADLVGAFPCTLQKTTNTLAAAPGLPPPPADIRPKIFGRPQGIGWLQPRASFAGGQIFEFQAGPGSSICNGNQQFLLNSWSAPPNHHSHSYHPTPGERLICVHRHGARDLTLGVSQSHPFLINGGLPL